MNKTVTTGKLRRDLSIYKDYNAAEGDTWVIFDPVSDKYYRLHNKEYKIISCLFRKHDLEELNNELIKRKIIKSPEELKVVLEFLVQNSLILPEYKVTEKILQKKIDYQEHSSKFLKFLKVYLFLRIPICDPDKFLNYTMPYFKGILNKWSIYLIILTACFGYVNLIINFNRFITSFVDSINYVGLIRFGIALIFIKIFHELGHAYAAKSSGIRIRKIGLFFMVFFPRLYIDLTDSWKVTTKSQKLLIDSAGIIVELVFGGITALIWLNIGPGTINSIAYYILTVSVLNTVFVNGNPLVRYDGYYLLMDFINIDNLRTKSIKAIKNFVYKLLFGIMINTKIKSRMTYNFLLFFGVASYIYRIFLYTGIILIVYYKFAKSIGIILLIIEVYVLALEPLTLEIRKMFTLRKKFEKKRSRITLIGFLLVLLILFLPLPWSIQAPCEIRPEEDVIIFAPFDGFIKNIYLEDNTDVRKNEKVFTLFNPFLEKNIEKTELEKRSLTVEYDQTLSDPKKIGWANVIKMDINKINTEINNNKRNLKSLTIKAPISGKFQKFSEDTKAGKWINKGEEIGEIYDNSRKKILAYFSESDIKNIKCEDTAKIYFPDSLQSFTAKVKSINTIPAVFLRPSPVLNLFGGSINVVNRKNKYELSRNYYQVELSSPDNDKFNIDRTGFIKIRKFSSVGVNLIKKIINTVNREMTLQIRHK